MYSKHSQTNDQLAFQTVPRPCQVYSPNCLRRAVYSKHSHNGPTRLAGGYRNPAGFTLHCCRYLNRTDISWFRATRTNLCAKRQYLRLHMRGKLEFSRVLLFCLWTENPVGLLHTYQSHVTTFGATLPPLPSVLITPNRTNSVRPFPCTISARTVT